MFLCFDIFPQTEGKARGFLRSQAGFMLKFWKMGVMEFCKAD